MSYLSDWNEHEVPEDQLGRATPWYGDDQENNDDLAPAVEEPSPE